ncbi:MAG: hypothetical protein JSV52_12275 [Candidatus Zixiibacteriota bacterium]|nr:MAG: hypothetical protein JSV52_12275 [candidate division Zixibacteria bacterium]
MFCPKCRYEYEPHIFVCPDCDEKLVATLPELPPETLREEEDWVELARLVSPMSAQMVLEVLQAKTIPAVILSEAGFFGQTGQIGPTVIQPVAGPYSVMVPADFVEGADAEAEAVLGEEWRKARVTED